MPGLLTKDESELLLTEIIYELNQKQPLTAQAISEAPTLSKDFVMSFLRRRLQAHSATSSHSLMSGRWAPTRQNSEHCAHCAQERVHLVICYSTVSEQFRSRALRFPALLSSCVIVYFPRWTPDALLALTSE